LKIFIASFLDSSNNNLNKLYGDEGNKAQEKIVNLGHLFQNIPLTLKQKS
jgi:hypothetical protein